MPCPEQTSLPLVYLPSLFLRLLCSVPSRSLPHSFAFVPAILINPAFYGLQSAGSVPAWWTPPCRFIPLRIAFFPNFFLYIQHGCLQFTVPFQLLHIGKHAVLPVLLLNHVVHRNVNAVYGQIRIGNTLKQGGHCGNQNDICICLRVQGRCSSGGLNCQLPEYPTCKVTESDTRFFPPSPDTANPSFLHNQLCIIKAVIASQDLSAGEAVCSGLIRPDSRNGGCLPPPCMVDQQPASTPNSLYKKSSSVPAMSPPYESCTFPALRQSPFQCARNLSAACGPREFFERFPRPALR